MTTLERDWLMLVDGRGTPAKTGATYDSRSPMSGEVIARVPAADADDVEVAVAAARRVQPEWALTGPRDRARTLRLVAHVLREHRAELALLDALDSGNPVRAMEADVDHAAEMLDVVADWADRLAGESHVSDPAHLHYSVREPFGVVGRIVPYNHPLMFAASKLAAPLLAGNAVVLKAPDQTPLSALRLGELLGPLLPAGLVNVLTGVGAVAGAALVRHPSVRRIAFTGSVATGQSILRSAADSGIKSVSLELGGKNPMVVLPDADVEQATSGALVGMNFTSTAGQSCGSTSRLLVHRPLMAEVVDRLAAGLDAVRVGDPLDPDTEMGTLVSAEHRDRVQGYIEDGRRAGLWEMHGSAPEDPRAAFVRPTVFVDVPPDSRIAREEIFGPVLAVTPFDDEREALDLVNDSPLGLTASLWTRDVARAHRLAGQVSAGYVWVNTASRHFVGLPFGGVKDSGLGREESVDELLSFTQTKAVTVRL